MAGEKKEDPPVTEESETKTQVFKIDDELQASKPENTVFSLGLAVSYMMNKKAFAKQQFGMWSRVLVGQINRGHFLFIHRGLKVVGFAGWSITNEKRAEDWLAGRADIPYAESMEGDCFVFNAWAADDLEAHRFLLDQMRPVFEPCKMIYYKRVYADKGTRAVRLAVNDFVAAHIDRKKGSKKTST